jgi:hypothetical protein
MSRRSFSNIIEPLVEYTCEMFNEITPQKLASIRLTYEIIREAIADLHGTNKELAKDAEDYFKSDLFSYHCECMSISENTMLYIANNPDKYAKRIDSENSFESYQQL